MKRFLKIAIMLQDGLKDQMIVHRTFMFLAPNKYFYRLKIRRTRKNKKMLAPKIVNIVIVIFQLRASLIPPNIPQSLKRKNRGLSLYCS